MPSLDHYANAPEIEDEFTVSTTDPAAAPLLPAGFDTLAFLGPSGDHDPHLMQYYSPVNKVSDPYLVKFFNMTMRKASTDPAFPQNFLAIRDERPQMAKETLRQQQHARLKELTKDFDDRLINIFFRFIYPTYPIVDQREFLRAYREDRSTIDVALLSGIYAISCIWWKYDKFELCQKHIPQGIYDRLYGECRAAVEQNLQYPTLGTMQGLLLLAQKNISSDIIPTTLASSIDISVTVATAHRLGLHLDCSSWPIPAPEKRLRKRLWTVTYLVEKWNSANLGVPSLLSERNTTWPREYSEPAGAGLELFVQLTRLTTILDEVVQEFYSVRDYAARYADHKTTISKVETYMKKLHDWRNQLSEPLKNTNHYEQGEPSKNGILHLAEVTIAILLLRLKIHPLCTSDGSAADGGASGIDRHTAAKYRQQAWTTIQRVITYTTAIDHWHLHSFWHSMTSLNFCTVVSFFILFKVTATSSKEHKEALDAFRKWQTALQRLAGSWDGVKLATVKINAIYSFGKIPEDDEDKEESGEGEEPRRREQSQRPALVKYTNQTDEKNRRLDIDEANRAKEAESKAKEEAAKLAAEQNPPVQSVPPPAPAQVPAQAPAPAPQTRPLKINFPIYARTNKSPPIPQREDVAPVNPSPPLSTGSNNSNGSTSSGTGFDDHMSLFSSVSFHDAHGAANNGNRSSTPSSPFEPHMMLENQQQQPPPPPPTQKPPHPSLYASANTSAPRSHSDNAATTIVHSNHSNHSSRSNSGSSSNTTAHEMIPMPMNMSMSMMGMGMDMEMGMEMTMDMDMGLGMTAGGDAVAAHDRGHGAGSGSEGSGSHQQHDHGINIDELDMDDMDDLEPYFRMGLLSGGGSSSGNHHPTSTGPLSSPAVYATSAAPAVSHDGHHHGFGIEQQYDLHHSQGTGEGILMPPSVDHHGEAYGVHRSSNSDGSDGHSRTRVHVAAGDGAQDGCEIVYWNTRSE